MIELHDNRKYDLDDRLSYLKEISGEPNGLTKFSDGTNNRLCRLSIKQQVRLNMNISPVFSVREYE